MKKSEMINKIEKLLESIGYVGPSNSGEKVVELIESCGMLPPWCNISCHPDYPLDAHVWEGEDNEEE